MKKPLSILLRWVVAAIIVFVGLPLGFFLCIDFKSSDWVAAPAGYIRNQRFVVGKYVECSSFLGSCRTYLKIVDMQSYARREQTIFTLYGDRPCYIKAFTFLDSHTIRVAVAEHETDLATYDIELRHAKPVDLMMNYPPDRPPAAWRR